MTEILGPPTVTENQADAWAAAHGATSQFRTLASIYWRLASTRGGVRPEVAYAQAAHETGWGRFGGVIDETFHNPCGLKRSTGGANDDPDAHQRFSDWPTGVAAHLDHLALYAAADGYPRSDTPDPRHFGSIWGAARTVEQLGGRWAPSPSYGRRVAVKVADLLEHAKEHALMTTDILLGVGHGATSAGRYDPGTVNRGLVEHELAHQVVDATVPGLRRSGVTAQYEQDAGAGHDPNWPGTAAKANELRVRRAVEVHFNAGGGRGAECFYFGGNAVGRRLAAELSAVCAQVVGIPDRGAKDGSGFGFLRTTRMTAVLLEVAFVDGDHDAVVRGTWARLGERLAQVLAVHLGKTYVAPPRPQPAPPAAEHAWYTASAETLERAAFYELDINPGDVVNRGDRERLMQAIRDLKAKASGR